MRGIISAHGFGSVKSQHPPITFHKKEAMAAHPSVWAGFVSTFQGRKRDGRERLEIIRALERVKGIPEEVLLYLKVCEAVELARRWSREGGGSTGIEAEDGGTRIPDSTGSSMRQDGDEEKILRKKKAMRFRNLVVRALWSFDELPLAELLVTKPETFEDRYERGRVLCVDSPMVNDPRETRPDPRRVPRRGAGGVPFEEMDPERAVAEAQHTIGWMYERGQGVPRREAEALFWYRLAAKRGHSKAIGSEVRLEMKHLFSKTGAG